MASTLTIIEPTTLLRDWARTLLTIPQVWAGGWPQGDTSDTGVLLDVIGSTVNGPVTTWTTQWRACTIGKAAGAQPAASTLASELATAFVRLPYRTVIGTTPTATVLYGGAIESSISLFPSDPDPDDPDTYGTLLLVDLVTIAVPNPPD